MLGTIARVLKKVETQSEAQMGTYMGGLEMGHRLRSADHEL